MGAREFRPELSARGRIDSRRGRLLPARTGGGAGGRAAPGRIQHSVLFTAAARSDPGDESEEVFLWPVRAPVPPEHLVDLAMREWIRIPLLQ
jgi:hypothetical protein